MRKSELSVVGFALLLFVLVGPLTARRGQQEKQEVRQEEIAEEEVFNENGGETYKVIYKAPGMKENSVADILWLRKAAEIAKDAGIPHFNVLEKRITREYNRKVRHRMNVIEGIIELDNDPMSAEYDAHEILSLLLPSSGVL